jgi:hypothetical protein
LAGNDKYTIDGNAKETIRVRIIGGIEKDSIIDRSSAPGHKTIVYENPGNLLRNQTPQNCIYPMTPPSTIINMMLFIIMKKALRHLYFIIVLINYMWEWVMDGKTINGEERRLLMNIV